MLTLNLIILTKNFIILTINFLMVTSNYITFINNCIVVTSLAGKCFPCTLQCLQSYHP